jgi:hypothetical protein
MRVMSLSLNVNVFETIATAHYREMHHQHDEVRLIDYARLCEHLSPRKIILLQLFRTAFRRLVIINSL